METIFSKYHGAGNDFLLVEDFEKIFPHSLIKRICHRHLGIGADGLILAHPSAIADFEMVYFNADGSRAEMCGNGLRCFVHFLRDKGYVKPLYKIAVSGKVLTVKCEGSKILTFHPFPKVNQWETKVYSHVVYLVETGVPHAVIFAKGEIDVLQEGGKMRHYEMWQPEGVNVNFVWVKGKNQLVVRTFERGVESETQACGTGAISASFVAHKLGICDRKIEVKTRSDAELEVTIGDEIILAGPSVKVLDAHFF